MTGYDLYLIIITLLYIGMHFYANKIINERKKDQEDKSN